MKYEFQARFVYELPDGDARLEAYGVMDPIQCMLIDLDMDAMMAMADMDPFEIVSAEVLD